MPGTWSETAVGGHPAYVFEPARPSEHGYVVLYLHGLHQADLRRQQPFAEEFDRHGLRVVAPLTGRSWWTDRICPEFDPAISAERHVFDRVLPWIDERWNVRSPRIALLGTSMGGQGALRFAFRKPDVFPVVAAIAPAIDYHLRWDEEDETLPSMYADKEAARQDTCILHVHPLNWPRHTWFSCDPSDSRWHASAERLRMKLSALGIPHECDLETQAGGHGFTYYNHMAPRAMEFIASRLERERLRVV